LNFLAPENVLQIKPSAGAFGSVTIWLGEAVFGHRLWHRQTPWLVLLEFLNVAEAFDRRSALLDFDALDENPAYDLRFRMGLRQILFNGGNLERIASTKADPDSKWAEWLAYMNKEAGAPARGFDYLRDEVASFDDFAHLVRLLRQTAIESGANTRWSSRFIFPMGRSALYSDAAMDRSGRVSRDYTVFGRSGELLYQMLCRADRAGELRPYLESLLDPEEERSRLVGRLCAPSDMEAERHEAGDSFLPYRRHPAFNRLAGDWLAIFALGLPDGDALTYLAPLASLHLVLYQLETAAAVLGGDRPSIICEMIAPRRELVRQHAISSYVENDALVRRSLLAILLRRVAIFRSEAEAQSTDEGERLDHVLDRLREEFSVKIDKLKPGEDLDDLLTEMVERKLDQNDGQVHLNYGRAVGLVSKRGTNRYRYAPTDALLKTIVLATVPRRTEFGLFLTQLKERYGLVIGPEEAQAVLDSDTFDRTSFDRNRDRLEARLSSMGLVNRLSDGCAYVRNPFVPDEEDT
jgi:hypothetical protein